MLNVCNICIVALCNCHTPALKFATTMEMKLFTMLGLGWIPTLFVVISTLGYVVPYVLATTFGHVYFMFPAISDSGVRSPEALVFRELINISGFLSICNIYVRYRQYQLILEALTEPALEWMKKVNFWCTVDGCVGGIGVTFVANFKSRKAHPFAPVSEYSVHNIAAVLVFVTGLIYCITQTYISYWMITYNVNGRKTCHARAGLTISVISNFVLFVLGSVLSNKEYEQVMSADKQSAKLRWTPNDPGYGWHVISNIAEWLMCFSFLWFSLTFIKEFKKIRITSDFVEEQEREVLLNSLNNTTNNILDTSNHNSVHSRATSHILSREGTGVKPN